jgi:uncharacterized membrane protein
MTWYMFFKWVHVFAAVVWVGGALMVQFFALRALASPDARRQAEFSKDAEWVGTRVFVPANIILLLAGVGALENGDLPWGQNWIVFGLVVLGLSFAVGAGYLGPEAGRLGALIEAEGPGSPAVSARIRRILAISRTELVFLFSVVWAMVVKPVGDAGWFWGGIAVTVVVAALVLGSSLRGARAAGSKPATATD